MCMFTRPIESVTNTTIFARVAEGRQWLAYQMEYSAVKSMRTTAQTNGRTY